MEIITVEKYAQAIIQLLQHANRDCSSSKIAAKILLSAYNGFEWEFAIPDLCRLDRGNYLAAIEVIRGRVELSLEPQSVIEEGSRYFRALWELYSPLSSDDF